MAQTSILGRIGQLVRANINAILDGAEDPEKMLDQLVRDFTNNIAEAEEAVAQTIGNLRLHRGRRARGASGVRRVARQGDGRLAPGRRAPRRGQHRRGGPLRRAGQDRPPSPDRATRARPTTLETQVAAQTELADKLKDGLNKLRVKREELVQKRDELVSRAKMAQAQTQVQEIAQERVGHGPDLRDRPLRGARPAPGGAGPRPRGGRGVVASTSSSRRSTIDEDELEVEARPARPRLAHSGYRRAPARPTAR